MEIYAWMIIKIPSWPLLASVTSTSTIHIFNWIFLYKIPNQKSSTRLFLANLMTFSIDFNTAILTLKVWYHFDHFCHSYSTCQTFRENLKNLESVVNGWKMIRMVPYLVNRYGSVKIYEECCWISKSKAFYLLFWQVLVI